jgi:3-oxoadipate enol-lactonase
VAVADAAGVKKFSWCGLSMGGMVGQWMGANARDSRQKLVLSTRTIYADKQPWHDRIKFARDNGPRKALGSADGALVHQGLPRRVARTGRQSGRDVPATKLDGFIGCCEAVRDMDFRTSTLTITAPTMVIVGASPATLPSTARKFTR